MLRQGVVMTCVRGNTGDCRSAGLPEGNQSGQAPTCSSWVSKAKLGSCPQLTAHRLLLLIGDASQVWEKFGAQACQATLQTHFRSQ